MKNILRFLAVFFFLFASYPFDSYSQSQSRKMRKAEEAFSLEKYTDAIELYKRRIKKLRIGR